MNTARTAFRTRAGNGLKELVHSKEPSILIEGSLLLNGSELSIDGLQFLFKYGIE